MTDAAATAAPLTEPERSAAAVAVPQMAQQVLPQGQAAEHGRWIAAAAVLLAVLSTGVAYILYFRLIAHTGPTNASAVTFLIPAFAAFFGWLFLDEAITLSMVIGAVVILIGTALAMGIVPRPRPVAARSA